MAGQTRARDRPVLFFCLFLEVFMELIQLTLLTHRIYIRSWCGKHWLIGQWRRWDGEVVGEYLIEQLEVV